MNLGNLFELSHIHFLFDMFRTAMEGIEWFVLVYFICITILFVVGRKHLNLAFVYPVGFMILTIFNPFLIVPLSEVIGLTTRIRRLFWLLPVNFLLAYGFTVLCTIGPRKSYLTNPPKNTRQQLLTNRIRRGAAFVICVAFVSICGSSVKPYLQMPENIYKTTSKVMEISKVIEEDSQATGTEKIALYSSQQLLELRQYDPSIQSILRRSDLLDWEMEDTSQEAVRQVIKSRHSRHILAMVSRYGIQIHQKYFLKHAKKLKANYIIAHYDTYLSDYLIEAGYEQIGMVDDFEIYRIGNRKE